MPKTTPKAEAPAKAWDPKDAPKFVRCELTAAQKALLTTWAEELEDMDLLKWVDSMVSNGHTLSIKSAEVGYQCSLTGVREASGHAGMSLVARASTPLRAVYGCMYRQSEVLKGPWPVTSALADLDF
jgi:hypothetical protein